jgi:hypothetical protein
MEGTSMRIECVNDASFIVGHAHIRLVLNQWPQGIVFNSRWTHAPAIWIRDVSFGSISPVYFSAAPSAHFPHLDLNSLNSHVRAPYPKS